MRHHHKHPAQFTNYQPEQGFWQHLAEYCSDHINPFKPQHAAIPKHAMASHESQSGGRGTRGFGGVGGGGGFDQRDGFNRGRKFSSQDLQLLLLALLADKPAHGYELIKALELRTNGFYTPSPGMVYPALTYLEELGYVTVELNGNRKCYAISDAGKTYLAEHQERIDAMLDKIAHIARKMDTLRRAYSDSDSPAGDEHAGWLPELMQARHAIKAALLASNHASKLQQQQVVEILRSATKQINAIFQRADK